MTLIPLIFISSDYVVESDSRFLLRRNDKSGPEGRPRLSAEEWASKFEEWADSFPEAPPIPDEAVSRENQYPDRW